MSKETLLNRQFTEREVQRMRNIVMKKHGDKTQSQIGYENNIQRKEGDTWEEQGKTWTIKNGIKQNITRLDNIKKSLIIPLTCPNCSKPMKNDTLNKKMWPIHSKCFDCVITMETELKRIGKFEEYARNLMNAGAKAYIKDLEDALLDLTMDTNEDFVTEAGDIEKWAGKGMNMQKITQEIQEHIQELKSHIDS